MATTNPKKPTKSNSSGSNTADSAHNTASKDIWLAGLGAMAQAQAQARVHGSKAFEALVAEGLAFQKKSQATAQADLDLAVSRYKSLLRELGL